MKSDEIRNQPITMHGAGLDDPQNLAVGCAGILQELTAQLAELNESRKPRWVNLSDDEPCLVDATRVIVLSSGMRDGRKCVIVRLRDTPDPFTVFDSDHDEVRFQLGIDEDWLQPPRYTPPDTLPISNAEWDAAHKVVELARSALDMLPDTKRNQIIDAINEFDNFQMPF